MAAGADPGFPLPAPLPPLPPPPPQLGLDESSDSDTDHDGGAKMKRKVSTSGQIRCKLSVREGFLMKQTSSFQRWRRRYFKLRARTLYYAKDTKSLIFDEVELTDASVAESSTKNVNNSFTIITPFRRLILCAENRKEMEDWIAALKSVQNRDPYEPSQLSMDHFSGLHNWYACSHARPTYCNVCREALSGVTSHGLSCEVCKFKAHKRCAVRATNNCKWTTLASIGRDILEDEDGVAMPHQWLEGNLPVSARCSVCDKTCGSVMRLQDWRCLWCKAMVHGACRDALPRKCPLGQCKVSVIPPPALNSIDSDGFWKATCPPSCSSPLLVFVNSKSGDNQGVKFLRRFKQLLNPAQVFDLMNGGPHLGLRLFQKFDTFRILVCGGDGSVGWVLSEIDKLNLHKQCQMGVLPLGTGNDLARVLGWGAACDDDTQLPQILEKLERASTKMLDRWSIMTYETRVAMRNSVSMVTDGEDEDGRIAAYEDSVAEHLTRILNSDQHSVVISSATVLCETVKDFVARVGKAYERTTENPREAENMARKCAVLKEKLDSLLRTLNDESQATATLHVATATPPIAEETESVGDPDGGAAAKEKGVVTPSLADAAPDASPPSMGPRPPRRSSKPQVFRPREQLMSRANSLKKAIRQIIEQAEKAVDEQNAQTQAHRSSLHPDDHPAEAHGVTVSSAPDAAAAADCEDDTAPDSAAAAVPASAAATHAPSLGSRSGLTRKSSRASSKSSLLGSGTPGVFGVAGLSGSKENLPILNTRIINQSLRAGLTASLFTLGACVSPSIAPDADSLEGYTEKCVMNNYFGIGLDAKISLDFNNRREEHPEKYRSRTKNIMWYGVLGTKELLQKTYKNLEQRVLLECDGQPIPLPSLQGIAVLNICSYAGGTNFWGGTKENDTFTAPSFDDKILEVVAVFGSMQMAVSRVINLQYHRIAQCRTVRISILGEEGLPVQVDGEAWVQPPGFIRIAHRNRAQMLTRDRAFESTLKLWEDKQHRDDSARPGSQHALQGGSSDSQHALQGGSSGGLVPEVVGGAEAEQVHQFAETARLLMKEIRTAADSHHALEQELAHAVNAVSHALATIYANTDSEPLSQALVLDLVHKVKALHSETAQLLCGKLLLDTSHEERLGAALGSVEQELHGLGDIAWLSGSVRASDSEGALIEFSKRSRSSKFRLFRRDKNHKPRDSRGLAPFPVQQWGVEEVGAWLELLSLGEHRESFARHDIHGTELLQLERRDLKELGISKVGHVKRILNGIKELNKGPAGEF
ncbi:diacylglycerol kinase delta-like isoform X2 [Lampetra planeri]